MFITCITDCFDANASARQVTRYSALCNCPANVFAVKNDLEAAGTLLDALDAAEGNWGIIVANVAPRSSSSWWINYLSRKSFSHERKNGTPFCYFYVNKTLVISSIDGFTLSLVKKAGVAESFYLMDIPTVLKKAADENLISKESAKSVTNSQFRSFDFIPRVAEWLTKKSFEIPAERRSFADIADIPASIWFIDNFGNCKTTIFADEIEPNLLNNSLQTKFGVLPFFSRLADVPAAKKAVISGSSGIYARKLVEIVIQGKNASAEIGLKVGDIVL